MSTLVITGIVCFIAGMLFIPLLKLTWWVIEFLVELVGTIIESLFM